MESRYPVGLTHFCVAAVTESPYTQGVFASRSTYLPGSWAGFVTFCLLAISTAAHSHGERLGSEFRFWSLTDARIIEARLVRADAEVVTMETRDGARSGIELAMLMPAERDYVKTLFGFHALNPREAAESGDGVSTKDWPASAPIMPRSDNPSPELRISALSAHARRSEEIDLGEHLVLLEFWSYRSRLYQQEIPFLRKFHHRYGPRGLRMLSINIDELEADHLWELKQEWGMDWLVAGDAGQDHRRRWRPSGVPARVLIGSDGSILLSEGSLPQFEQAIRQALGI